MHGLRLMCPSKGCLRVLTIVGRFLLLLFRTVGNTIYVFLHSVLPIYDDSMCTFPEKNLVLSLISFKLYSPQFLNLVFDS